MELEDTTTTTTTTTLSPLTAQFLLSLSLEISLSFFLLLSKSLSLLLWKDVLATMVLTGLLPYTEISPVAGFPMAFETVSRIQHSPWLALAMLLSFHSHDDIHDFCIGGGSVVGCPVCCPSHGGSSHVVLSICHCNTMSTSWLLWWWWYNHKTAIYAPVKRTDDHDDDQLEFAHATTTTNTHQTTHDHDEENNNNSNNHKPLWQQLQGKWCVRPRINRFPVFFSFRNTRRCFSWPHLYHWMPEIEYYIEMNAHVISRWTLCIISSISTCGFGVPELPKFGLIPKATW